MNTGKINVTRILKEHLFPGKNGKYLDIVIWENKKGPDQYGNTHTVCQDIGKEARERGEKGPIIGNVKMEATPFQAPQPAPDINPADDNDEVPF